MSNVAEQIVHANGVELCTESLGDPAEPPILLIMGTGASMLWWEEGFCRMLADRGRFVIRYDHRDTGQSVTYEPGRPAYTGADLAHDAAGVLDAYGIGAAHLVGVSAGGGARRSSRSTARTASARSSRSARHRRWPTTASSRPRPMRPDSSCRPRRSTGRTPIGDRLSGRLQRLLAGGERPFDDAATRDLVRRDVERARDFAAAQNHDLLKQTRRRTRRCRRSRSRPW